MNNESNAPGSKPAIVITGTPDWLAQVRQKIESDYHVIQEVERAGYVPRLTDARAALILVDGTDADCLYWTTAPKANNATRRVPIIVATDDSSLRREVLLAGADIVVSPDELKREITTLIDDYARVESPETIEQLDCECQDPLPPRGIQGVEKFNAREYYRQHDLFEAQWMETEGPVRDLYRAILQVGIAYYQIERGNYRGALKMLLRSVQWLSILPDVCQGVDVQQLRADAARVRAELESMNPADIAQFDRSLLKPVRLVDSE